MKIGLKMIIVMFSLSLFSYCDKEKVVEPTPELHDPDSEENPRNVDEPPTPPLTTELIDIQLEDNDGYILHFNEIIKTVGSYNLIIGSLKPYGMSTLSGSAVLFDFYTTGKIKIDCVDNRYKDNLTYDLEWSTNTSCNGCGYGDTNPCSSNDTDACLQGTYTYNETPNDPYPVTVAIKKGCIGSHCAN